MNEMEIAVKIENHERRITQIEGSQTEMAKLVRSVDRLSVNVESAIKKLDNHGERLTSIEMEPAKDSKYYRRLIVGYLITSAIATVLGLIMGKLL